MKKLFIIPLFFLITSLAYSQDYHWTITIDDGKKIFDVLFEEMEHDSVLILTGGESRCLAIQSISEIRRKKKSRFWKGAGIGFAGGAAVGAIIGRVSYKKPQGPGFILDFGPGLPTVGGALIGGTAGFVAGGIIGAKTGREEVYELSGKSVDFKKRVIRMIL